MPEHRKSPGIECPGMRLPSESNPLECVSVTVVSVAAKYRTDHITQERMPNERPRVGIWADSNPCQGGQGSGPDIARCEAVRLLPTRTLGLTALVLLLF